MKTKTALFLFFVLAMIFCIICAIGAAVTAFMFDSYEIWFHHTIYTVGFMLVAYICTELATILAKQIKER